MLKTLGKWKRPFLISVPFSELLNAIPYDAGTYCRIPEVKVDQRKKSFGPDVAQEKKKLLKTAQTIQIGSNEISFFLFND